VKLHKSGQESCDDIEFEVQFIGIEPNKDATINWVAKDIQNNGIFYTDSNGLHLIKRTKKHGKND